MKTDQPTTTVLVFGAQHPTGLMTARSLRGCGAEIIGLAFGDSPCLRSSIWSSLIILEQNPEALLQAVRKIAEERSGSVLLLPAGDESVKILSDHRYELPPSCILVLPESATVDLLLDKSRFYSWAEAHGFSVPKTLEVTCFPELDAVIKEIGYPLLLKPLYRDTVWEQKFPDNKVFILETAADSEQLPRNLFAVAPVMLAQQWIPGTDADVYFCLVCYDQQGKLINHFCGRKLMQWPPLGGSTAVAISDKKEKSRELTQAIFDTVGYQGLGSVEYKKDPRNGKLYIMEPTVGRNDFQSYLAVTGNVNLTRLAYYNALGVPQQPAGQRRPSSWICEPSFYYGLKYYLRRRDAYFLRYLLSMVRRTGFAYLDLRDRTPFIAFVKSRLK